MTYDKPFCVRPDIPEDEIIESIVDILDKEMAAAKTNPGMNTPSRDMDLLVADLLGYLNAETIED